MEYIKEIFRSESFKRNLFFAGLIVFFYITKSVFNLLLLTFLFTYLINSFEGLLFKLIGKILPIKKGIVITVLIYSVMAVTLGLVLYKYIPMMAAQAMDLLKSAEEFTTLETQTGGPIENILTFVINQFDLSEYLKQSNEFLIHMAKQIGEWGLNIFLALLLSLFFMLEKESIIKFTKKLENSSIKTIYGYACYFGKNFLNSFGKVIQAQILIAANNTIISTVALYFMGFPQVLLLGLMIFILSLIPVAGTFISLVPLCMIAFKIGGIIKVVYVLIMITVVHAIEAYVLNPKFMSSKTELPIFYTFVILIVGEHFMGIWGLLLGIPIFIFLLELIGVDVVD